MMRHSKKIVAMLLMAICLMGILPLSVLALSTQYAQPQPYFGKAYRLVNDNYSELYITQFTQAVKADVDIIDTSYYDSGVYTDTFKVVAYDGEFDNVTLMFDSVTSRKPITWAYSESRDYSGILGDNSRAEIMIGFTSLVVGTNTNVNFGAIMYLKVYRADQLVLEAIFLSRALNEDMILEPTPDTWVSNGGILYFIYVNEVDASVGALFDIGIYFEDNVFVTWYGTEENNNKIPNNLALDINEIPDIIVDGYTELSNEIFKHIDAVWGQLHIPGYVVIMVLSAGTCVIMVSVINRLFKRR